MKFSLICLIIKLIMKLNLKTTINIASVMAVIFAVLYYIVFQASGVVLSLGALIPIIISIGIIIGWAYFAHQKANPQFTYFKKDDDKINWKMIYSNAGVIAFLTSFLASYQNTDDIVSCLKTAIIAGITAYLATLSPDKTIDG